MAAANENIIVAVGQSVRTVEVRAAANNQGILADKKKRLLKHLHNVKTGRKCQKWLSEHLDVDRFVGKYMRKGRRSIDERHDAQAVVHQGHVRNNNVHESLSRTNKTKTL